MENIHDILSYGESSTTEFKASFNASTWANEIKSKTNPQLSWQYPLDALRELVLNMIIHRDYRSSADSLVKVFPNYILFFNPGTLPDSITLEQLLSNAYVSTPRNRQIARIIKEMGLIEKYGTGIRRVCNMLLEYGLPKPEFLNISGGFAVKVFGEKPTAVLENELENELENVFSEREKQILHLLSQNSRITQREISETIGITPQNVRKQVAKLKQKGVLIRIGADKGGHWKVNENTL